MYSHGISLIDPVLNPGRHEFARPQAESPAQICFFDPDRPADVLAFFFCSPPRRGCSGHTRYAHISYANETSRVSGIVHQRQPQWLAGCSILTSAVPGGVRARKQKVRERVGGCLTRLGGQTQVPDGWETPPRRAPATAGPRDLCGIPNMPQCDRSETVLLVAASV